ncbi:MAG: MarR family transcriptional regulator [Mariprofundales bacterium]|nr:MarR family transcriptional regulator [Mariprofundales bacterium]
MSFQLDQAIGMHVNRTAFLMSEEIAKRFSAYGHQLSAQDFGILFRLSQQSYMTQGELAAAMNRDKTTITRRLDGLVKKALVERSPDPNDRRYYRISLTATGSIALGELVPLVSTFQQELLKDIPAAEQEITINTLKHITKQLLQLKNRGAQ